MYVAHLVPQYYLGGSFFFESIDSQFTNVDYHYLIFLLLFLLN